MLKNAGRRLRTVAMVAVAGALAVAGVASAKVTGADSAGGDAPKASNAPAAAKAGPGGKPGPAPGGPPPAIGGPGANLTYGELHVLGEDGKEETIRLDQGELTGIEDGSLELKENDGSTVTVKVDDDTAVMDPEAGPGEGSLEDLETGDEVTASGPQGEAAETVAVVPSAPDSGKGGPKAGAGKSGPPPAPPATDGEEPGEAPSNGRRSPDA